MNLNLRTQVLIVFLFVASGIALANPVEIYPAKCVGSTGSCIEAANKVCVDTQGDGICDYTRSAWQPV